MNVTAYRDPVGTLDIAYSIHGGLMSAAYGVLVWLGIGVARTRRLGLHATIQTATFVAAALGFIIAVSTRATTASDERSEISVHGILGLLVFAATIVQALLGWLQSSGRCIESTAGRTVTRIHRIGGYALGALAAIQMTLGLATVFRLCASDNGGIGECVGAFGWALAIGVVAIGYHVVASRRARKTLGQEGRMIVVLCENGYAAFIVFVALFREFERLGEDWRASAHLIHREHGFTIGVYVTTLVVSLASLVALQVRHRRRRRVGWVAWRAIAFLILGILGALAVYVDSNHANAYSRMLGITQLVMILAAILSRVMLRFRSSAFFLTTLAVCAAARQRGFERDFTELALGHDDSGEGEDAAVDASVAYVVAAIAFVAITVHVLVDYWCHTFARPAPIMDVEIEDEDLDDLSQRVVDLVNDDDL